MLAPRTSTVLDLAQARRLQLAAQGLLQAPPRRARREDLLAAVARMRLLQIDSINVVARSPYLVLHARLGDYDPQWLDELLAAGRLAECWAHEACFVGAADYALHRAWRGQRAAHWAHRHAERMYREHREGMDTLLARIREAGPLRAADFASAAGGGGAGWWSWKPEKRWLEAWFALGELMVAKRERFQRVYDLAERVLPRLDPPLDPGFAAWTAERLRERMVLDSVRALGVTQARWIADYFRLKPAVGERELATLVERGELLDVAVEGWKAPGYVHRDHAMTLDQAAQGRLRATRTALLSPFDPLVWDRARALAMFDFAYTIECYVPEAKRRYGYYVLPVLRRGRLVGRLDAKAHRAEGVFEVKAAYLEPGIAVDEGLLGDLAAALAATARWHGTPAVRVVRSEPKGFAAALRGALRQA